MSDVSAPRRRALKGGSRSTAQPGAGASVESLGAFWNVSKRDLERQPKVALHSLLDRVQRSSSVQLYDAVELGVPTAMVMLMAGAFGQPVASMMQLMGVSETTFRRKDEAAEPLPEVSGHRVMGLLRIMSTLRRLLAESGDPARVSEFDLEAWISEWIRAPLPQLGGKTPAEMLRNPEGHRAVEDLLERMRGGLPA